MKAVWTKPAFEESTVGAECTAYAAARRVGVTPHESKPDPQRDAASETRVPPGENQAS